MRKLLFENEMCSRCGGSGQYSYCQSYGTRCFKCHGDTVTLTKRGMAAQRWFNAKKMKPAREAKVGDKIVFDGIPGFSKSRVVEINFVGYRENDGNKYKGKDGEWHSFLEVSGLDAKGERCANHCFEDSDIKMHVSGEALVALRAEAKAYEATLTKAGTVRKRSHPATATGNRKYRNMTS
jgi:hypothetical protein